MTKSTRFTPLVQYRGDFVPFKTVAERLKRSQQDSDVSLFYDLLGAAEFLLKLQVAALVASVKPDPDQTQFALESRLVRADGLGEWAAVLDDLLSGPSSPFVDTAASPARRELTETLVASDDWRSRALAALKSAAERSNPGQPAYRRAQLRQWAHYLVAVRNKEKAHGAPDAATCAALASSLGEGIDLLANHTAVLTWPWAVVSRQLSGKYRVVELSASSSAFQALRRNAAFSLDDGVYIELGGWRAVRLASSDPGASDFFFANGGFSAARYERLSYGTGKKQLVEHGRYSRLPAPLPGSTTRASESLVVKDQVMTNMPDAPAGYVSRGDLERELFALLTDDRHPVVTLSGRGGIGKTSLALEVLHQLASEPTYDVIWWFSARDIDLLPEGPKRVRADVADLPDISRQFAVLAGLDSTKESAVEALRDALSTNSRTGRSLFVFDNFETVASPVALYQWLDECVRLPNKLLVTTRVRNFKADYPVEVTGMTAEEFAQLVSSVSGQLTIAGLITPEYVADLYRESGGHPYVAKILLGEVARTRRTGSIERIMASSDEILVALFERTFSSSLSPASQRVFLTLSGWRSVVPELAVKAALLRPTNERMDVDAAIEELIRSSMVEAYEGPDGARFLRVPLAAQLFGAGKLRVSADKVAIDSDIGVIRAFGAAKEGDVRRGLEPRVQALLKGAGERAVADPSTLTELRPIFEFVATHYAPAWLGIAKLYRDIGDRDSEGEALRRYLQMRPTDGTAWKKLALNSAARSDVAGELTALLEFAAIPSTEYREISEAANRLNAYFRDSLVSDPQDRRYMAERLREVMERRLSEADATDLSRLGWLCVNLRDVDAAVEYARQGLSRDPNNPYCQRLAQISR